MIEASGFPGFLKLLGSMMLPQLPGLAILLVGTVMGAMLAPRARAAGLLLMGGCGLLMVGTIAGASFNAYLINLRNEGGMSLTDMSMMQGSVSLVLAGVHALGLIALIAAAAVGRAPRSGN